MKRSSICALPTAVGEMVTIKGFVTAIRDQKHVAFIMVRDRTGAAQVVCEKTSGLPLDDLTPESAVTVTGKIVAAPQVKVAGGVEIQCNELIIETKAETPLPIASDSASDKQLDWRFLGLRDPKARLIFEVQTTMMDAMRGYWQSHDFIEIHSPKLMGTASESGAEVFKVKYFDTQAYLAQSPQFYKQMAMAAGFERVFEVGPVFRAEPSFTTRHATEYISIDMEVAWVESHEEIMQIEEAWLQQAIQSVKDTHGEAIKDQFGIDVIVPSLPFPRITLEEARTILAERGHVIAHKADLDPAGERLLSQYIKETIGHEFVFVTDYPAEVRAFYHKRQSHDLSLTQSFDLLWKGLEITTGAMREQRVEKLMQQAQEKGMSLEPLQSYFDFFRYGCPPHGGCGVGMERLLMVMLGLESIREAMYLFRGPNRLTP
jgi:nondiscriminating aspartyl-tRNA synthetase